MDRSPIQNFGSFLKLIQPDFTYPILHLTPEIANYVPSLKFIRR